MLASILVSTLLISAASVSGAFSLLLTKKHLQQLLTLLVALSAGTMLGGAFIHLLPEAHKSIPTDQIYLSLLTAYVLFFFVESILHLHHSHQEEDRLRHHRHTLGLMNLLGDVFHNFLDGLVIASAFAIGPEIGIPTTLAVAFHEIPQEIGDFGVLLYAGFSETKALLLNFLVALSVVVGGLVGYVAAAQIEGITQFLIPFAAGSFIYIATSDLVPQIKAHQKSKKALLNIGVFMLGIGIMYLLQFLEVH